MNKSEFTVLSKEERSLSDVLVFLQCELHCRPVLGYGGLQKPLEAQQDCPHIWSHQEPRQGVGWLVAEVSLGLLPDEGRSHGHPASVTCPASERGLQWSASRLISR